MPTATDLKAWYAFTSIDLVDGIRTLLDAGLPPDTRVRLDAKMPLRPLLCVAAMSGAQRVLELLLERGAKVDLRDDEGLTPLMLAAREDHAQCVSALIAAGADRTLAAKTGETAAELAKTGAVQRMLGGAPRTVTEDVDAPARPTAAALEARHNRKLPALYRAFVETKAYATYDGQRFPVPSYPDAVEIDFGSRRPQGWLEIAALLDEAGAHDKAAASHLIPFAAIVDGRGQFLLVDASQPTCAIVLLERATGNFIPVAPSLEAFLESVEVARKPAKSSPKPKRKAR